MLDIIVAYNKNWAIGANGKMQYFSYINV